MILHPLYEQLKTVFNNIYIYIYIYIYAILQPCIVCVYQAHLNIHVIPPGLCHGFERKKWELSYPLPKDLMKNHGSWRLNTMEVKQAEDL